MLGTDANGHVGKHNDQIINNVDDLDELPSIGIHNPKVENGNGTQLRTFLNETGMVAVNTHVYEASGSTWMGSKGYKSRVDFIILDR